ALGNPGNDKIEILSQERLSAGELHRSHPKLSCRFGDAHHHISWNLATRQQLSLVMAVDASQIASRGESDSYACDVAAIRVHHLTGHYGQFIMLLVLELSSARFLKILYILIFYLAQAALEIAEQGHGYYYADSKATEQLLPGVYVLGEGIDYPPG